MKRGEGAWLSRIKIFLEETDAGLLFLSAPVCLAIGIGLYFMLPFEPSLLVSLFPACLLLLCLIGFWKTGRHGLAVPTLFLCLICLGISVATYRTAALDTRMLERDLRFTIITGAILDLSPQENGEGVKLIIAPETIEKLTRDEMPQKVALTVRQGEGLSVGQRIEAKAALKTPSGAFVPGGFSFRRYNYFQGIGAQGYTYGPPEILEEVPTGSLLSSVSALRAHMTVAVLKSLNAPQNGITAALLTGQRDGIGEAIYDAMREAGLAHMLAISGLHVGLFAGIVFFAVRFILALFPPLALHFPIKKIAAFTAILAALTYTIFVGANIPALRALVTTALIFTAVIVDRSPISLRLVALAALLILLVQPEALVSAGFQMSFGAVSALVLFYDRLRPWMSRFYGRAGFFKKAGLYICGVALTSLVASFATAPFALYHFQTLPLYGLAANLAAMPILSFWVMPCAVLAYIAFPFGLEDWPLKLMGEGVYRIIQVAETVSSWPHAVFHVAQMPLPALFAMLFTVFAPLLCRSHMSRSSTASTGVILTCLIVWVAPLPQLLWSDTGEYVGFRAGETLYVSNTRAERFRQEQWSRALNISQVQLFPEKGCLQNGQLCCDETACRFKGEDTAISWLKNRYGLQEECADRHVQALTAPFGLPQFLCADKPLYSRQKIGNGGGLAAYAATNVWKIVPVENSGDKRPWSLPHKD